MSSNLDINGFDVHIRYYARSKKWIVSSNSFLELYVQADELQDALNQISVLIEDFNKKNGNLPQVTIRKPLVYAASFIHFGSYAITKNKDEDYWFYFPVYTAFDKIEIKKQKLNEEEIIRTQIFLKKIEEVGIPEVESGFDGQMFTIRIGGESNVIEYEWWSDSAGDKWIPLYELRDFIFELSSKYNNQD